MIGSRLIKSNDVAAGCEDIVDAYDPFGNLSGVALYQLNGNANDVSGNYNGTATNVTYSTGVFGQAGVFNGSNTYLDASGFGITGDRSVSFWVKNNSAANGATVINTVNLETSSPLRGSGEQGILIRVDTSVNKYYLSISPPVSPTPYIGDATSDWNHIVIVDDSVNYKIYFNGAYVTQTAVQTTREQLNKLRIGKRFLFDQYFSGSVDQVRIFNTALTPLEVEALYTEELCICGGTVDTLDILDDNSCIATYQFDGNTNDLSGNYSLTDYVGGATATYTVGEFDLALAMRSSIEQSNYIANLNIPNHNSESSWIKVNTFDDDDDVVFAYYIRRQGYTVPVVWTSAGGVFLDAADNLPLGVWTHVVLSIDGTTLSVYYDGQLQNTKTVSNGTLLNGVGIIADDALTTSRFEADQVRVFNKALSAGEVTTLYNETACTPAACTSGTTNTLDILGDGSCIATYPLDGSPLDLSGNYNGVQTDVTYPQGYFDLAGSFNGSRIQANNVTGFPSGNAARSVSVWVKMEAAPITGAILMWGTGASNQAFVLYPNYTELNIATYGPPVPTGYNFTLNQWTHIVVTHDGTTTKIYADNVLVDSFAYTYNTATNSFVIGNVAWAEEPFQGDLDQVRIFNKALSAGEVTTLYNETPCN